MNIVDMLRFLPLLIGAVISLVAGWRIFRRWFVMRVRLPIRRYFTYKPARAPRVYRID
jgi:hypothetical protein